ncbi:hypothetical protein ACFL6G_01980 [candidate division KSB1 bacterium]
MDAINNELAGISASIAAISCHYLEYHLDNALKLGADEIQIQNAVKIGLNVMEVIDYRIIKIINSKLPDLNVHEVIKHLNNYSNYWIRIPF